MRANQQTNVRVERSDDQTVYVRLYLDEQPVSSLIINERRMRIGATAVKMGGIGGVDTRPEHRLKGYMRQVMDCAVQLMHHQSYDVSTLFGIRNFYTKWGFASWLSASTLTLRTEDAGRCSGTLPVRTYRRQDLAAVVSIYNRQNARRSCSIVRPRAWKRPFRKGSRFFCLPRLFVVTTPRGRVVGYAAVDDVMVDRSTKERTPVTDQIAVAEVGGSDPSAHYSILAETARQAQELGIEEIAFHLPIDHPFAVFCRRWGATARVGVPADGAAMGRIIRVPRLLRKLRKELGTRLRSTGLRTGRLWVETDAGSAGIRLSREGVRIEQQRSSHAPALVLPQWALFQGLIGTRDADALLADERVTAEGDVRPFAEALFPLQWPYMWTPDHF
jgi:GNAT superfamily N-acetyltransferase